MKRKNFSSKLAVIAAAALTMSLGTGLTASADSYQVVTDPIYPWGNSYVHIDEPHPEIKEPVKYYEPVVKQPAAASNSSDEVETKAAELSINAANFPDAVFRSCISENCDIDESGTLSDKEISNTTYICVNDMGISSLKGIEYFTDLKYLHCENNNLTQLDVSKNTALELLYGDDNNITQLNLSNNTALTFLGCDHNKLTQLDVSKNTALTWLNCYDNKLTQLDVSKNTALTGLNCAYNNLTQLDVSKNTALIYLKCGNNNLTQLDVSKNTALESLSCFSNNLTQLDVSKNTALIDLSCGNSNLTQLELSNNTALESLSCHYNNLTRLDLSNNTALTWLACFNNNLTQLDVSNNTALNYLSCYDNNLTQLDVSNNTALTSLPCHNNNLTQLDVSNCAALEYLYCYNNNLTQLDVSSCTALEQLYCYNNNLKQLDVSNCATLSKLYCSNNNLTQLDFSNGTALEFLFCNRNNLTQLNVSNNTALIWLSCGNNNLTQLDVSNNTALTWLSCGNNNLSQLDVSNCAALTQLHCAYNYFQSKSSIIGFNEAQMYDCEYVVQYYEGFKYKDDGYDISQINFNTPDHLEWNKILTKNHTYIQLVYEPNLTSCSFDYSNITGAPEKLVTDDGIVFIPRSQYEINSKVNVVCTSSNKNNIKIGEDNSLYAYESGKYTLLYTVEFYDDKGEFVSKSKEFVVTAVDQKDHTMHEYSYSYDVYLVNGYHVKRCFCSVGTEIGNWAEIQPHSYEMKIVPYLDGMYIYYNQCTECGYYYAVGAKNSKTLTDEATGIEVTDIEGNAIPDGAQLYVTDVTDTENVELKNVAEVLDISLKSNGVEIQPDNTISVTIPVPEKVNGAKAKVFRKEADGTFTDMNAVYNPQSNKLSFVTDHLSIYAVVSGSVLGDVNNDGELTPRDLTILGKAYMQEAVTAEQIAIADMDGNGKITPKDITALGKLYMSMQK